MSIKIEPLSYFRQNILPKMDNDAHLLPLGIKDSMDNVGRTVMEYKRGGKDAHLAGRERAREEWATTAVWLLMRPAIEKYVMNPIMKHVTKLDPEVDIKLLLRQVNRFQVVPQHLHQHRGAYLGWALAKFAIGTAIPVAIIGMGIPRWNQAMTRRDKAKELASQAPQKSTTEAQWSPSIKTLQNLSSATYQAYGQPNTGWYTPNPWTYPAPTPTVMPGQPFRFGALQEAMLSKAATFVTDSFWGNVAIDLGISGGRLINARNPIDRMEYAGRELSIIAFMYWAGTAVKNKIRDFVDKEHNISTYAHYNTLDWIKKQTHGTLSKVWAKDMGLITEIEKALPQFESKNTPVANGAQSTWRSFYNRIAEDLNPHTGQFKNKALALAHQQKALQTTVVDGKHVLDTRKMLHLEEIVDAAKLLKPTALESAKAFETFLSKSRHYKHWAMAASYIVSSSCTAILTPWVLHQITKWRTGGTDFPGTMSPSQIGYGQNA